MPSSNAPQATGPNPTVIFEAPQEVAVVHRPQPNLHPGELLIRTRKTLISTGTELTILAGDYPIGSAWADLARFPFTAGYSNVGDVIAAAPDLDCDWVGARVASAGPHARHVVVAASSAYRSTPSEALLESQTLTTLGQIVMNGVRRAGVQWGEAVAVFGLGLLGQLAVRFCRLCGARPVVGIDRSDLRLGLLPSDPAVIGINTKTADAVSAVREATGERMVDVVIEATGNAEIIPSEFELLRETQGRFLVLSSPQGTGTMFNFHDLCNAPSHTIIGAHLTSHPTVETPANPWTMERNAVLFNALLADGEIDLRPLITHRFPYTAAPEAYRYLMADRSQAMALILDWDA